VYGTVGLLGEGEGEGGGSRRVARAIWPDPWGPVELGEWRSARRAVRSVTADTGLAAVAEFSRDWIRSTRGPIAWLFVCKELMGRETCSPFSFLVDRLAR